MINEKNSLIVVVGGSGQFANVLCEAAELMGLSVVGFVKVDSNSVDFKFDGLQLEPAATMQAAREGVRFVVAAGSNTQRRLGVNLVARWGGELRSVVHPAAMVSPSAVIGKGSIILAGAIVGTRANVGQSVVVNHGASVDHDCVISDFVNLSPGAKLGGSVTAHSGVSIGINASVLQGLCLGEDCTVGAGAVVTRSVLAGATVVGVPARSVYKQG